MVLHRQPVLRFDRLAAAEMRTKPYSWGLTSELFHKHTAHLLADEYPTDGFKTMLGADTEKSWSYEVRPLVSMGGATATGGQLSPAWTRFVDDIVSTQYRDAISDVTGVTYETFR